MPTPPSGSIYSPKKHQSLRLTGGALSDNHSHAGYQTQNIKELYFSALDLNFLYCVEIDKFWEEELVSLVNTSEYVHQHNYQR